jgi:multidrug resistance efflux pump
VVEVTPNVSGEVVAIPGTPNVSLKAGTVLFEINPKPYQYKVSELEAALVGARQQAEQLKASYEQATANVEGLTSQLHFQEKALGRHPEIVDCPGAERVQGTGPVQVETVASQLQAARAAQLNAKLALDSQINGETPTSPRSERSWTTPDGTLRKRRSEHPLMAT